MGLKDILLEKGPQIALTFLAAQQHGPAAAASFMRGLREAEAEDQQRTRQQRIDTRSDEWQRAQIANQTADNTRQNERAEFEKFEHAMALMNRATQQQAGVASDPVAAENAVMRQAVSAASAFGMEPDRLTAFVPNMAPVIAKGARADAAELLERAAAQAKLHGQPYNDTSISFEWKGLSPRLQQALVSLGHPEGQPVKPSAFERLHGFTVTPGPPPQRAPRSDFDEFYEAEFLPAEIERRTQAGNNGPLTAADKAKLRLQAREAWNRSGAAGAAAGRPSAGSGPSRSERQRTLRRRLQDAIRKGRIVAPILGEMQTAGLDSDLELSDAQRVIDREIERMYDRLVREQGGAVTPELADTLRSEAKRKVAGGSTSTATPAPVSTPRTIGEIKVFPNGNRGRWDGQGWVLTP